MSGKAAAAAVACAAILAPAAAAAVEIRRVDARGHPLVRATVVTSAPAAAAPTVREGRRPVHGLVAENLGRGKSVVLAIDRSRSMSGVPLADAVAGARAFVAAKARADRIAVVAFGPGAAQLTRLSSHGLDAALTLSRLAVAEREGTALYDALALAADILAAEADAGRVIVLVTDGRDVSSGVTLDAAVGRARAAGAIVHPIALRGSTYSLAPLRAIARETGGRLHVASSAAALPAAYREISDELDRTWRLEYPTAAAFGERLRIAVAFPGMGEDATATLEIPGKAATGPSDRRGLSSTPWGDVLVGLVASVLVLAAGSRVEAYRRARRLRSRIAPTSAAQAQASTERRSLRERLRGASGGLFGATERSFGGLRQFRALQAALDRADVPLRAAELLYAMLGAALLAGFLATASGLPGPFALLLMVAGGFLPYWLVRRHARGRRRRFEDQLPDLLMTLAGSLRAGHTFRQGIQTIVDEGSEPARAEFARVLNEARLGRPLEDALEDMAERLASENFSFVVSAVAIQRQVGGSLAGIFDMVAEAVRERQLFGRRVKAITAQGRLSAYVLIALPFFLAFALSAINREYMAPLFSTGTGRAMIAGALVSMAIGSIVLRKIVSVRS